MKFKIKLSRHFFLLLILISVFSCKPAQPELSAEPKEPKITSIEEAIPKVTGIGGIFFKSKDPQASKTWYSENLGLAIDDFGAPFEFRNAHRPEEVNYLNWDAFPDTTSYFDPSENEFMINYRVQNIDGLVKNLKANGVTIVDEIKTYEYGKFVHILDLDGHKIELWEPVDSVLSKMGRKTTK